ncbi:hypothetical protein PR048_016216 [Dryococelus australis]|uniref:Uncharacterized protein n=1 Tax=Dryococelus australis TaxID=614101 RepID=A0ABQ9HJ47_9NEOP|nr:hypothetical protein PR048_016216 [Dryococelus australis]
MHYWAMESLHCVWYVEHQRHWKVNVWCGIFGDYIIGSCLIQGMMTSCAYACFLRETLLTLLKDLPLDIISWPARSPDLTPFDFFPVGKRRNIGCTTLFLRRQKKYRNAMWQLAEALHQKHFSPLVTCFICTCTRIARLPSTAVLSYVQYRIQCPFPMKTVTLHPPCLRNRGGVVVRLLSSHLGEQGSIPAGVVPGFLHVGIGLSADFLGDLQFPPPMHSGATHTHLTSPSLALMTSMLRAAQIIPLNHMLAVHRLHSRWSLPSPLDALLARRFAVFAHASLKVECKDNLRCHQGRHLRLGSHERTLSIEAAAAPTAMAHGVKCKAWFTCTPMTPNRQSRKPEKPIRSRPRFPRENRGLLLNGCSSFLLTVLRGRRTCEPGIRARLHGDTRPHTTDDQCPKEGYKCKRRILKPGLHAKRFRFPAELLPDFRTWDGAASWQVFSGVSLFSSAPYIPALLLTHVA